jgi:hypothetical protein
LEVSVVNLRLHGENGRQFVCTGHRTAATGAAVMRIDYRLTVAKVEFWIVVQVNPVFAAA